MREADGRDYRLAAWVIMPNHVHVVVEVWKVPLAKLIGHWKGKSARLVNVHLGRSGKFWQDDYYDSLIRDETHLKRAIRYTEQNPVKACLAKTAREWLYSSARRRDHYERLPVPRQMEPTPVILASPKPAPMPRFGKFPNANDGGA